MAAAHRRDTDDCALSAPKILKPLQDYFPRIDISTRCAARRLVDKIHSGDLDFGIMAFPYDLKGLSQRVMITERFVCAARKASFSIDAAFSSWMICATKELLFIEDGHCLRDHALQPVIFGQRKR